MLVAAGIALIPLSLSHIASYQHYGWLNPYISGLCQYHVSMVIYPVMSSMNYHFTPTIVGKKKHIFSWLNPKFDEGTAYSHSFQNLVLHFKTTSLSVSMVQNQAFVHCSWLTHVKTHGFGRVRA